MTEKFYLRLIIVLSVLIPVVVALLIFKPEPIQFGNIDVSFLPKLNAFINGTVTLLLITGFLLIMNGKIVLHKYCMITALSLSIIFLVSYVIYHAHTQPTPFGGEGLIRILYYFILISHITLAVTVVPLALISIFRGLSMQVDKHKKIVRWALPIWLYVSITGVLVYLMISPYYQL